MVNSDTFFLNTSMGQIKGLQYEKHIEFLGLPYAHANRFEYACPIETFADYTKLSSDPLFDEKSDTSSEAFIYDATSFGPACIQKRCYYPHLEVPERMFYHKEFREGVDFSYSENCLNLNIYTPNTNGLAPVLVFIHGGGFDSGCNHDSAITGKAYADKGIVFVSINYRVGVFGYLTHQDIYDKYGHDGNFGLDDQFVALTWIKEHISDFGGNPDCITVMGQSAGAMSIQYLCVSDRTKGLFNRAIMLSGAGLFPKFSLPRPSDQTHEYWLDVMNEAKASSLDEFKALEPQKIFDALELVKARRKDNAFNTMPVVDGHHLVKNMDELIKTPHYIDYMVGFTNNDMYTAILAHISKKYAKQVNGFLFYFDVDAPGDDNMAFHSSDLRYVFSSLKNSHRPYTDVDQCISDTMVDYICAFVRTGNPNHDGATLWKKGGKKPLRFAKTSLGPLVKMQSPDWIKLIKNTLRGEPK